MARRKQYRQVEAEPGLQPKHVRTLRTISPMLLPPQRISTQAVILALVSTMRQLYRRATYRSGYSDRRRTQFNSAPLGHQAAAAAIQGRRAQV